MFIKNINPSQSRNETVPFYSGIMRLKFQTIKKLFFLCNNFFVLFTILKNFHESCHKSIPFDPTIVRLKLHKLDSFEFFDM